MTFLRSLVLIGCLVGVPLIAVVGPSWPEEQMAHWMGKNPAAKTSSWSAPQEAASVQSPLPLTPSGNPSRTLPNQGASVGEMTNAIAQVNERDAAFSPGQIPSRDQFAQFEQRLRDLGASIYRLEVWGAQENLYHFHCVISRGSEQPVVFEETDSDPYRAVGRVVRQVEDSRATQYR